MFVILQPSVSAFIFPQRRAMMLHNFLNQVERKNGIDPQDFWQFREDYSPGNFSFNENVASVAGVLNLQKLTPPETVLLQFSSPLIESKDEVIDQKSWLGIWQTVTQNEKKVLFINQTTRIFYDSDDILHIVFVKPISDMEKANGFFDYTESERKLLADQYWLNETSVKIP